MRIFDKHNNRGKVGKRGEIARAGRARIARQIDADKREAAVSPHDRKLLGDKAVGVGGYIYAEAQRLYAIEDVPFRVRAAPWAYIITRLVDEHPSIGFTAGMLMDWVELYRDELIESERSGHESNQGTKDHASGTRPDAG